MKRVTISQVKRATINDLLDETFQTRIEINELAGWSGARKELFFLGLQLMRAAVSNYKTEYGEEAIAALIEQLPKAEPPTTHPKGSKP